MLTQLFSLIQKAGVAVMPFQVVPEDRAAIMLRLGRFSRIVMPGLCWKIPFADSVMTCDARTHFYQTNAHSLVTSDDVPVVVSAIMSFRVKCPKAAILSQIEFGRSVWDGTSSAIACLVSANSFRDLHGERFSSDLLATVSEENDQYGTEIITCRLQDIARAKTYRVLK